MSCCSCGNGCSPGCGCLLNIVLPDNPVLAYDAENINLTGIGVYNGQSSNTFQFRGVASANSSLIVTLDAGNNVILLTLDIDQIIDDLPQATTTQRGVGETATDAEAIAKASITTFLTPSNLAALGSTSTFAGLIEIATNAEAAAGASALLAITPASLAFVVATLEQTATFADSVARAAAVPTFEGQYGYQLDSNQPYIGFAAVAGSWNTLFSFGITNVASGSTTIDLNGNSLTFHSGGLILLGSTTNTFGGVYTFDNAQVSFSNTTVLDYVSVDLRIGGVQIPANSVLTTTLAGTPTSALKTAFLSTFNTQTGYTNFTNPAVLRTCDTTTVTLPQLAQIVGTLINDLKAVLLPAT